MLDLISFVGIDYTTDLEDVIDFEIWLQAKFGTLNQSFFGKYDIAGEYGFLYSETRGIDPKQPRYLSPEYIAEYMPMLNESGVKTSIHLCGKEAVDKYLALDDDLFEIINDSRVQLNFNMAHYDEDEMVEKVLTCSQEHSSALIVQINKSKKSFIDKLKKALLIKELETNGYVANIDFLYDASGGFSHEIKDIEPIVPMRYTGYAGGINSSNVYNIVKSISEVNKSNKPFYIDMESGVRDFDDTFDLNKCKNVVREVYTYYLELENRLIEK